MKVTINIGYNKAFGWTEAGSIRFIGYLLDEEQLIPDKKTLSRIFKNCDDLKSFQNILSSLNGIYSIIFQSGNDIFAASDPSRFFPLFYTRKDDELIISDDVYFVRTQTGSRELNKTAVREYLASAFTCENRTLFKDVYQVVSSEVISFSEEKTERGSFFSMGKTYEELNKDSHDELNQAIKYHIDHAFVKSLLPLKNRPILLPLSGGIDSRLIACKLKETGFTNVLCFTFGRRNHEVEISKRVAEKLGFRWLFVEYTQELIKDFHRSEIFKEYYQYASRGTSMFFLQEYPAIKWLIDQSIINSDYAVLPGHPGDLIRGSLILSHDSKSTNISKIANSLLKKKFIHSKTNTAEKNILRTALENGLSRLQTEPDLLAYSIQEDWELKERTSKYIINSSHAFTFFGLQCFFPLSDQKLLSFFRSLPLKSRMYGKQYKDVLYTNYFKPYELYFTDDIQPSRMELIINNIKKKIRPYLPISAKRKLLDKNDWVNYGPMTDYLLEELNENGDFPVETGSSFLYRILNWYLMKVK